MINKEEMINKIKCFFGRHDFIYDDIEAGKSIISDGYITTFITNGWCDAICSRCGKVRKGILKPLSEVQDEKNN